MVVLDPEVLLISLVSVLAFLACSLGLPIEGLEETAELEEGAVAGLEVDETRLEALMVDVLLDPEELDEPTDEADLVILVEMIDFVELDVVP